MRVVFIDTETSGVNPMNRLDKTGKLGTDQIIEYTLQVWQDGVRAEPQTIRLWPWKFAPDGSRVLGDVSEGAAKVNGYDPRTWGAERCFDWRDAANLRLLDGAIVGGHNTAFDLDMITGEFLRLGVQPPDWNYRTVDTQREAGSLVAVGAIEKAGLDHLCKFFGLPLEGRHGSATDVARTIDVWERFIDLRLKQLGI